MRTDCRLGDGLSLFALGAEGLDKEAGPELIAVATMVVDALTLVSTVRHPVFPTIAKMPTVQSDTRAGAPYN